MAQTQTSLVEQSVDRVQDALRNLDKEFQRFQKQVKTRRRTLEKRIETQRKSIEKQARKQIKAVRGSDVVKRAETLSSDLAEQLESGVETMLGALQIASKSDLERIDRKLNRLSRKLKELEKAEEEVRAHSQSQSGPRSRASA